MGIVERHPTADRAVDGGNGSGDDGGMEARLTKLEAIIPTLATREDLIREASGLRADLHKEIGTSTRWFVGWVTGVGIVLTSAVYFIATHAR